MSVVNWLDVLQLIGYFIMLVGLRVCVVDVWIVFTYELLILIGCCLIVYFIYSALVF